MTRATFVVVPGGVVTVVDSRPFHLWAIASGRRIIHGEQDAIALAQPNQQQPQQSQGTFFGLASQGLQEVI